MTIGVNNFFKSNTYIYIYICFLASKTNFLVKELQNKRHHNRKVQVINALKMFLKFRIIWFSPYKKAQKNIYKLRRIFVLRVTKNIITSIINYYRPALQCYRNKIIFVVTMENLKAPVYYIRYGRKKPHRAYIF